MSDDKNNKPPSKILAFPGANKQDGHVSIEELEEKLQDQIEMIRQDPCACECSIEALIQVLINHGIIEDREDMIHPRLLVWALGVTAGFIIADHMAGFPGAEASALLDLTSGAYEGIAITAESDAEDE